MADTALTVDSPITSTNTNILVDYEVMGNGNILIKYWVDNTAITNGLTGIEDIAGVFSESVGLNLSYLLFMTKYGSLQCKMISEL